MPHPPSTRRLVHPALAWLKRWLRVPRLPLRHIPSLWQTLSALALAALPAGPAAHAQPNPKPAMTRAALPDPPLAPRQPHDVSVHGDQRSDDWFWLRDLQDPRVLPYLKAENAYAAAWLAPHRPLQEALYQEALARLKQDDEAVPYRIGAWWYASRTLAGQPYPVHFRRPAVGPDRHWDASAPEQLMFDLNAMAVGKKYLALTGLSVSPDGRLAAYTTDETGGRDHTLQVRDIALGRDLDFKVPQVSSMAWAADGRTLFYVTMGEAKRSDTLWRCQPGSGQPPVKVWHEADPQFDIEVAASRDGQWLKLESASKDESETQVLDARQPTGTWRTVLPRRAGVVYEVDTRADRFWLRINDTGPDFRLITLDAQNPRLDQAQEVLPAQTGRMIEQVDVFRHHLVVTERRQGLLVLRVRDLRQPMADPAAEHLVQFDQAAYTVHGQHNREADTAQFRFSFESMASPPALFDYAMDSRERRLLKQQPVLGGFDPTRYVSERLMATAPDGTAVPVSLVYRRDLRRSGPQPLLLLGYGSYGSPYDPQFSSARVSLLDRGVVMAIAHVRGGGDLGRSWYEAGKMARKANTFSDFIACAEALVQRGFTTPAQLGIEGGSAGGLLMGAVVNARPDLFTSVVAHVPFVDVINTMLDETIPLTVSEFQEWGNPKLLEQYRWMRAYSPYDNLKPGAYPAMLLRTSLNDSQVAYWEPAKYTAKLRTLKNDSTPLLLTINLDAGHGGASGRFEALRERAEVMAFQLVQWGLGDSLKPPEPAKAP